MPTSKKVPIVTKTTARHRLGLCPGMSLYTMSLLNQKTTDDGLPTVRVVRLLPQTVVVRPVNFTGWGFVRGRTKWLSTREMENWDDCGLLTGAEMKVLTQDFARLGAEARGVAKAVGRKAA